MLVRWHVTQSRLQKLGSTGISRSLAAFPSGKKPNSLSTEPEKNRRPAPPGGGRKSNSLKWACLTNRGLIQGWNSVSALAEDQPEPQRLTTVAGHNLAGFFKGLASF